MLNAALLGVARAVVDGLRGAPAENGLDAAPYITQNHGTLTTASHALDVPVLADAIVVDVGGTCTDIGILVHGLPREFATAVQVGGVRTNFLKGSPGVSLARSG